MAEGFAGPCKDPRSIARKYQLELAQRAAKENVIVYLGTGCGKTHIALLLMHELSHLLREPSDVFIFLAPTIPLVRQQALVIENSINMKVRCFHGNGKNPKDHCEWEEELRQCEVLVMTPQILLYNLQHCLIKMDQIALLIFDECHHAQAQTRHPYARIMKEFYRKDGSRYPRIFGMTASPIIGKGGTNRPIYTKCMNSLEDLLDSKVCSVDNMELETAISSPKVEVYLYSPLSHTDSDATSTYRKKLEDLRSQCELSVRESRFDMKESKKKLKYLWKVHDEMIFCLINLGLLGAQYAAKILLSYDGYGQIEKSATCSKLIGNQYLSKALSVLSYDMAQGFHSNSAEDCMSAELYSTEVLEQPFFSSKLLVLIQVLSKYRSEESMKCIVFVKRIIAAKTLARILGSLPCLNFWQCEYLIGCHSGSVSRNKMNATVEKFSYGKVDLLIATSVAEEGLDIQSCRVVVRFDLPETVASYIQSRGRARMLKSKFIFLLERGNLMEQKLLKDFVAGESIMNGEVAVRTSNESFDPLDEAVYRVNATGASISTGSSVSLLHRYCSNLPHDNFFFPKPKFDFWAETSGIICRVSLPPNAAIRQAEGVPCVSKDEAKRNACLNACMKLHELGALTDYLLPVLRAQKSTALHNERITPDDESLQYELHELVSPEILKPLNCNPDGLWCIHFYFIRFVPIPDDRTYRKLGLFTMKSLPKDVDELEVDLHLAHGRIVKAGFEYIQMLTFNQDEMVLAQKFQEMCLKIVLDRSEFFSDYISLGTLCIMQQNSSFYLVLPVKQTLDYVLAIDWETVNSCLSSPIFRNPESVSVNGSFPDGESFVLLDGVVDKNILVGSLIFTPHNKTFYFVDDVIYELNSTSKYRKTTYAEHYLERFRIQLSHKEQPLLKVKQLFNLHNLLCNRVEVNVEVHKLHEHFIEMPPELCSLKIIGFSKDIGSSLSLLPSLMHRLENFLVAAELKDVISSSIVEALNVKSSTILEALTTEKCLERFSYERLEVLGDAFLKYSVGRHSYVLYDGLDEGQLTRTRSAIVSNSNLHDLAIKKGIQGYIRDRPFEASQFFGPGRPCKVLCTVETESSIHQATQPDNPESSKVRCNKWHHWFRGKTIADAVEALVGAFLVDSGFKAAFAFLQWIGISVQVNDVDVLRACESSSSNLSVIDCIDIVEVEKSLGYTFNHKGLLLQALIHPSFNRHSGGCYQKLEYLGDAVLEYLITSYLYSAYPLLKPGQLTDLRSAAVNNILFARIAIQRSLHKYLIKDSINLANAINELESFLLVPESEKDYFEEPASPKVLGDIVESCVGAVLLDSGFDLNVVWDVMLTLLAPVLSFAHMDTNPLRELRELCQSLGFTLNLPAAEKVDNDYFVNVEIDLSGDSVICCATNRNIKAARKIAAQSALSKLKVKGYKHKNKTLQDVLRTTSRILPVLIGFDEEPCKLVLENSREFKNMSLVNSPACNSCGNPLCKGRKNCGESRLTTNDSDAPLYDGMEATARSCLFELCAANFWERPVFECWKIEGPCHQKRYTFKASLHIKGKTSVLAECYSDPKMQKKAAKEHAAEGILWYLKKSNLLG